MDLSKDYLYNREKIILLVCDFYETSQIPKNMFEIKDNLALFPVANIPLVEYILTSLMDQQLKNVIITGNKIESIVEHIKTTKFMKLMNIRVLKSNGKCIGDLFREIYNTGYEFWDLVVMYANHYTNVPISQLIKQHRKAKDTIMTVFTHKSDTNDTHTHIYATQGKEIRYYEKVLGSRVNSEGMMEALRNNKSLYIFTWFSSPTIAVISGPIFSIFSDNFDYETLGDFMAGMLASGLYNYNFQMVSQDEIRRTCIQPTRSSAPCSLEENRPVLYLEEKMIEDGPECSYSKEIITLLDYFKINDDVLKMSSSVFRLPQTPNYVKGHIKKMHRIENSVIGERSEVEGGLRNCIVWENCHVLADLDDYIIVTDGSMFNVFHLELNVEAEEEEDVPTPCPYKKAETFFDDFTECLNSVVDSSDFEKTDFDEIFKQISLLRIVWNASRHEVIEAFAFFFVEIIDSNDLESTVSKGSEFFGILAEFVQTMDDQELLMECIHWNLHDTEFGLKTQIFFNYAFLLVERGIVERSVVKSFNKMHKSGTF